MRLLKNLFPGLFASIALLCFSGSANISSEQTGKQKDNFYIGWASVNITPDKPVLLAGQFHARVSEGIMDPVTSTILAIESGSGATSEKALMITCELVKIDDKLRDEVRRLIVESVPEIKTGQIFLNATHTHSAPFCSPDVSSKSIYGIELDAMAPAEALEFISKRIANAAVEAWKGRKPGGISYGLGHAVVGHNRLQTNFSGKSQMYGDTNRPEFSHIEGFEDHSVNLLYTWDANSKLTGVLINLACPSQVSEQEYHISADYWHDTRLEVRKRLGNDIYVLSQCSAAGDQSPHIMIGSKAEDRMQRLMGIDSLQTGRGSLGRRKQIAVSIADAVTSVLPYTKNAIDRNPVFVHKMAKVDLSRRLMSQSDVDQAVRDANLYKPQYDKLVKSIQENPAIKQKEHWYFDVSRTYSLLRRGQVVQERYELEKVQPKLPVEIHVIRLGDIAFATNPFELYVDYGMRIKSRSAAVQTFLVQLTGSGTYVPTARSIAGGAYGAVPASTLLGPEGGQEIVEKSLELINSLWQ